MRATSPKTAWSSFTGTAGTEGTAKPPIRTVGVLLSPDTDKVPGPGATTGAWW